MRAPARRVGAAAVLLAAVLALSGAPAAGVDETIPVTTTTVVLRESFEPVPLPSTTTLPPAADDVDDRLGLRSILLRVIAALVAAAAASATFTVWYVRRTRPRRRAAGAAGAVGAATEVEPAGDGAGIPVEAGTVRADG